MNVIYTPLKVHLMLLTSQMSRCCLPK